MKKIIIVSYSRTGRNLALATELAKELSLKHIKIYDENKRSNFTITLDLLFNRTPKIKIIKKNLKNSGLVILIGPVWFGKIAFPLRACLKLIKKYSLEYVFISLSGGGDGPSSNPHLNSELKLRTSKDPLIMMNLHVADFLPADPKPTPQEIDDYKVSSEDIKGLIDKIKSTLRPFTR